MPLADLIRPPLHRDDALFALLLLFAALLAFCAPTDNDLWWHLRTGQLIAASGVPLTDPYSFTAAGREWIDHEWLAQRAMAALQRFAGYPALALGFGLVQAAQLLLVWRRSRRLGAGRLPSLLLVLLFLCLAASTWGVRPQILGPLFTAVFIAVLEGWRRGDRPHWRLALLPPLMLAWVNLHASAMLGLALPAVYLAGEWLARQLPGAARLTEPAPLLVALASCALAGLVNPYGLRLWTLPLSYAGSRAGDPQREVIEWHPVSLHDAAEWFWLASLLALLALTALRFARERRIAPTPLLLAAGFAFAAARARYFFPYYAIVALPLIGSALAHLVPRLSAAADEVAGDRETRWNFALLGAGALLIPLLLLRLPQAQTAREPQSGGREPYPEAAARYLLGLPSTTRLYNDFGWGGFLIARLYPRLPVFIDGRIDLYRGGVFADLLRIRAQRPGWRETLASYGIDTAVVATGEPLDRALAADPQWQLAHDDAVARVYRRADPAAR